MRYYLSSDFIPLCGFIEKYIKIMYIILSNNY